MKITPVTHASLLLQAGGKNIYINPAQGSFDGLPPAGLILITDIHADHMSQPNIGKVRQASTVVFGPKALAEKVKVDTVIANGETKEWGGFQIQAVPAYNTYGGKTFYFSGDTEAVPEVLVGRI